MRSDYVTVGEIQEAESWWGKSLLQEWFVLEYSHSVVFPRDRRKRTVGLAEAALAL